MFSLTLQEIKSFQLYSQLQNPHAGGFVSFEGWVRNHHEGKKVKYLEYEAFTDLCLTEGNKLANETIRKFSIIDIRAVHRVGPVNIGELAVWIGVTSVHRGEAFKACEFYINELKSILPIWKKEFYEDGTSIWVECQGCKKTKNIFNSPVITSLEEPQLNNFCGHRLGDNVQDISGGH